MRIIKLDADGDICRVVTEQRGSWKWQDAFRLAFYEPAKLKNGKTVFRSIGRTPKFAHTRSHMWKWTRYGGGSLHHREITRIGIDDYGNQYFVTN